MKGRKRQAIDLARRKAESNHIIKDEIMQGIGPHDILRFLSDFSILSREQLRADGCIQNIVEYGG